MYCAMNGFYNIAKFHELSELFLTSHRFLICRCQCYPPAGIQSSVGSWAQDQDLRPRCSEDRPRFTGVTWELKVIGTQGGSKPPKGKKVHSFEAGQIILNFGIQSFFPAKKCYTNSLAWWLKLRTQCCRARSPLRSDMVCAD